MVSVKEGSEYFTGAPKNPEIGKKKLLVLTPNLVSKVLY
jgi:hypothetical protein